MEGEIEEWLFRKKGSVVFVTNDLVEAWSLSSQIIRWYIMGVGAVRGKGVPVGWRTLRTGSGSWGRT
jgi:ABC-type nitrate/sulfonate/bicarbonate transport system ATPase subunit